MDISTYDSTPSVLSIEITPPGFNRVTLPYQANQLTVYNAPTLQIDCEESNLPDGLYKVRLSYSPAYENFVEYYFYRTVQIESLIDTAYIKSNLSRCGKPSKKDKQVFDDVYMWVRGAKAAAAKCEYTLAEKFYQKASKELSNYSRTNQPGC